MKTLCLETINLNSLDSLVIGQEYEVDLIEPYQKGDCEYKCRLTIGGERNTSFFFYYGDEKQRFMMFPNFFHKGDETIVLANLEKTSEKDIFHFKMTGKPPNS